MGFSPKIRGRAWVATIQVANMQKSGLEKEQYENPEFIAEYFTGVWNESGNGRTSAIAVCISEKGLYHCHMALYGNTTTLSNVSKILFDSHIEPQLGGKAELAAYIEKTGKYAEKGEQVLYTKGLDAIQERQGNRNDLDEIGELIKSGMTPKRILEQSFRYWRYEKMIRSAYINKRINETPLKKNMWNEYHVGETGTGKTYTYIQLCEQYSEEEVYLCNDYSNSGGSGGGFDFYANNPAKIIVLDEFRGTMPYHQFLSILDVYSRNQQHCRYQNIYNLWTSVIICSIYPPEQVYSFMVDKEHQKTDSIRQLFRRLNKIVYHYKENGEYKTFSVSPKEYIDYDDLKQRALASSGGFVPVKNADNIPFLDCGNKEE